jgi:pyridoxine/pyridoxamine 5'-phosphate oxidase
MMLNQMKDWLVQLVDLTGNDEPEAVLTFKPDPTRNYSRPRTLILQDNGVLIYSELTSAKGQSVTGIADVKDGGSTALVVETATGYTLQRWSSERGRFEF